jgi:hypothetical protein
MSTKSGLGFTLVEVLIISPIIILFIGAFIALAVNLTGESLTLREKNIAAYDVQSTLDDMEATISQSTSFLDSTSRVTNPLTDPQGSDDHTAAWTGTTGQHPDTLVLQLPATSTNPLDANRSIIYTGAGSCNAKNPLLQYQVIYFVKSGSLYKRTIIPVVPACTTPWQRNSCSTAGLTSNPSLCKVEDDKLLDNVTDMNILYYQAASDPDSSSVDISNNFTNVNTAKITLSVSKQVAGNTTSYSSSVRATSLNAHATDDAPAATTPAIAVGFNDPSSPYKATFSWDAAGNATGYNIRYRLNSGSWVNGPQNTTATSYDITGTFRKQTLEIEVTALSSAGNYLYGTKSATIPRWNDCTYQNGWSSFGTPYMQAGFTKTSSGLIGLRGLVKSGTVGQTF